MYVPEDVTLFPAVPVTIPFSTSRFLVILKSCRVTVVSTFFDKSFGTELCLINGGGVDNPPSFSNSFLDNLLVTLLYPLKVRLSLLKLVFAVEN